MGDAAGSRKGAERSLSPAWASDMMLLTPWATEHGWGGGDQAD